MKNGIGWTCAAMVLALGGCRQDAAPEEAKPSHVDEPAPTNRIAAPSTVRQNLGITFARVEHRPVRQTLRLPGSFELRPEAVREFRVMAPGRVDLRVTQFERVEAGTLLLTLDSPEWRRMQHEAVEAEGDIKVAQAALDVAIAQKVEAEKSAMLLKERIANLEQVQIRKIELEAQLAELTNSIPRLEAEIQAKRVGLDEANEHYSSMLNTLASLSGMSVETLLQSSAERSEGGESLPHWRRMNRLQIHADVTGIVDALHVTNGGWVDAGGLVMTIVDPSAIRFHADALQADMARLSSGQQAAIVPPQGRNVAAQQSIDATVMLGHQGSPDQRTIPLYATPKETRDWAKPGVSAFLEVFTTAREDADLAIPVSAVVQDGLSSVFFRRNPANPDEVIRMEGDLGPSDGRWIVINSGVKAGDEVVVDGAYQLMLATSGSAAKGGHFHADGTFHEDEH
jgi:multidrug efflux pump subunit AcrA (membrane-fusion protein)